MKFSFFSISFIFLLSACGSSSDSTDMTIDSISTGGQNSTLITTDVGTSTGGGSTVSAQSSSTGGNQGTVINTSTAIQSTGGNSTIPKSSTGGNSNPSTTSSVVSSTGGSNPGTGGSSPTIIGGSDPGIGGSSNTVTGGSSNSGTGGSNPTVTGGSNPGTGGSNPTITGGSSNSGTGGSNPTITGGSSNSGTGGSNPGTGGAAQVINSNFTPFPACTDTADDPTCSPSKASVQGHGTCPDINLPDYQTAVQIATHQSPSTDPCTAQTIQNIYKYIIGSGTSAYIDCISDPNARASCPPITACWQCLIDSHSLMGGTAGYWFNYTVFYSTNSCSKIVWNLGDCLQQACSDVTSQKDYASCVASAQLPVTPNVPKSGLCYKAYGAASIAIFNEVPADQLDVTSEKGWEYYAERLCGN